MYNRTSTHSEISINLAILLILKVDGGSQNLLDRTLISRRCSEVGSSTSDLRTTKSVKAAKAYIFVILERLVGYWNGRDRVYLTDPEAVREGYLENHVLKRETARIAGGKYPPTMRLLLIIQSHSLYFGTDLFTIWHSSRRYSATSPALLSLA